MLVIAEMRCSFLEIVCLQQMMFGDLCRFESTNLKGC